MMHVITRREPDGRLRIENSFADCRCSDAQHYFGCDCADYLPDYRPGDHVILDAERPDASLALHGFSAVDRLVICTAGVFAFATLGGVIALVCIAAL
jgi:hypothetical protein